MSRPSSARWGSAAASAPGAGSSRRRSSPKRRPESALRTLSLRLDLDGGAVTIRLRRSARARRYSLRVSATARDALLTMPERGSLAGAEAFVLRHGAWLAERLAALPRQVPF